MAETEDLCLGRNSVKPVLPGGNPRGRGKPRPYKGEWRSKRGEERPASEGGPYLGGDYALARMWAAGRSSSARFQWARLAPAW
jgi:hypothetical protein